MSVYINLRRLAHIRLLLIQADLKIIVSHRLRIISWITAPSQTLELTAAIPNYTN